MINISTARDIESFQCDGQLKYSVCTLVTQQDQYQRMLDSFRAGGFTSRNSEFIFVDNSQGNKYDGFEAINRFLRIARGDYIILCHQDIRLLDDRLDALDHQIDTLNGLDPRWAVLGNAGGVCPGQLAIRITDPSGDNIYKGSLPARVTSLDENFILVRRDANLSVSRDLQGFHFYGTDLCMIAMILGFSCYVVDFHIRHIGGESLHDKQNSESFKSDYFPSRKRFIEKYQRVFAPRWIQNTGTSLFISGSRKLNLILNWKIFRSMAKRYYRIRK